MLSIIIKRTKIDSIANLRAFVLYNKQSKIVDLRRELKMGTKTDRRILRTKKAINRAFLELFTEKEFDRITINDISVWADVNRGTFYLHYMDKYDLLDQCIT